MLAEHAEEYNESLRLLARDRFAMGVELARMPELSVYSSQANFLLVKLADTICWLFWLPNQLVIGCV